MPGILSPVPRRVGSTFFTISNICSKHHHLSSQKRLHARRSWQFRQACLFFPLCSTIHAGSHNLAWFQSPRLFAFAPSPDRLVAFTPPSSAAATSALLRASRYRQWQFPTRGGGDAAPRETASGRQLYTAEVNFLSSVTLHRPPQSSPQLPGVNRPQDESH